MRNHPQALFLSAAKPTDQGEESVFLLLVVVEGGLFFSFPCTVFWCVKRQKLCLKRGVKSQKLCLKRGVKRQNSVYHGALFSQNAIFHAADQ